MPRVSTENLFKPKLLNWAVTRTGLPAAELVKKLGISNDTLAHWQDGTASPTIVQAEKLAKTAGISFPLLFLNEIPDLSIDIPDFQTPNSVKLSHPSLDLEAVINHARLCQDWYREFLQTNDEPPNRFTGLLSSVDDYSCAAAQLVQILCVNELRQATKNQDDFLRALVKQAETVLGVCVMRCGHVKTNAKRTLNPQEFRGFALADAYAPLVFINTQDALSGQVFTLIHELVHVARNQSGVSGNEDTAAEERYANTVAGIVLIPDDVLPQLTDSPSLLSDAERIAKRLRVSSWSVLTRARSAGRISEESYHQAVAELRKNLRRSKHKSGGSDFYQMQQAALGKNLAGAMISAVRAGQLPYRDMWQMTGIKPANVGKFSERVFS